MKRVVIIGAGQNGRGYIARLLYLSKQPFIFIDKSKPLIEKLNREKSYRITFSDSNREDIIIDNYEAYYIDDPKAIDVVSKADIVFTSIAEQNLPSLVPVLKKAVRTRKREDKLAVVTCENGISPKQKIMPEFPDGEIVFSESIIFCTTLQKEPGTLDIVSEDIDYLPYDIEALGMELSYHGMVAANRFHDLLQRKIYTYNCLSACISYPGYYKEYTAYGEAANDEDIKKIMQRVALSLNESISKKYNILKKEQAEFTQRAIRKFQNKLIIDTIDRNARDVQRKLGRNERMVAPLLIMNEYGCDTSVLELVVASALFYGINTKTVVADGKVLQKADEILSNVCRDLPKAVRDSIYKKYQSFEEHETLKSMLEDVL